MMLALLAGILPLHAGVPAKGIHPIFDLHLDDYWTVDEAVPANEESGQLVGGTIDGQWVPVAQMVAKMSDQETFRLYATDTYLGQSIADRPQYRPDDEGIGGWVSTLVDLPLPNGVTRSQAVIGICGGWNALPRVPKELSVTDDVYLQVVQEYLTAKGQQKAKVHISRILQVDLDGDNVDEELICAVTPDTNFIAGRGIMAEGDYSVILLRKHEKGRDVTIPVVEHLYRGEPATAMLFRLSGAFDVNGDGVMEIFVHFQYSRGFGSNFYSVKGQVIQQVLNATNVT